MKQIIQDLKNGNTILEEVPAPMVKPGSVLIKTTRSLVSLGTERMLVEFGRASLIEKARQQPEKVKMVLDKMKSDGLLPTLEAVFNKLGTPLPLGYCNVGRIVEIGSGVTEFQVGDRVASIGPHAEFVCVPKNLIAKIPDSVTDDEASFTVIGSIGLQGIRLLNPTFGETVAVIGLGLIGMITAELLKANGCKVVGFDFDQQKIDLAKEKGIDAINPKDGADPVKTISEKTDGIGCDGVVITASNKSNDIISQAARMSRKRGRIVLVGVIGLELNRTEFYEKELTFQVSCSYGPGRYDSNYEDKGNDYPFAFVRWTEKRNFEAILNAISSGQLDVQQLITAQVKLKDYNKIYGDMKQAGSIASIIEYSGDSKINRTISTTSSLSFEKGKSIGIIGAGNFTGATLLPAIKGYEQDIKYIASANGLSATTLAKKASIDKATSDYTEIFKDQDVGLVIITTRHNLHASMVVEALKAGKNVFVEKPLCLNKDELKEIKKVRESSKRTVTVGFNRRFANFALKMKKLQGEGPCNITATMNAGYIPSNVWVHDLEVGGGRIVGEACHFIDLFSYLAGSKVTAVCMNALGSSPAENTDNASILLKYENGTNAVINYFSNGSKSYSKERVEVYKQEKTLIMDNWRTLQGFGYKGFSKEKGRQDKGHSNQFKTLFQNFKSGGAELISFDEIENTTLASFACIDSLKKQSWIEV